ncbi:MAG TPA: hypothetical protein VD993_11045 [Chitinophagaceae bacterium]|nr:hypothetical protein [Chitinophagaceae bacterium]
MESQHLHNPADELTARLSPAPKVPPEQLAMLKHELSRALEHQHTSGIVGFQPNRLDTLVRQFSFSDSGELQPPAVTANARASAPAATDATSAMKVFRRELPVRTSQHSASVPSWAAGMKVHHTLGPFVDEFNKWYWFDFYVPVRHVQVVRGIDIFLLIPLEGILVPKQQYDLSAGSVWIRSQLFTSAAPAGAYTGLKIKGGTLSFKFPVTISGDSIIINAGDDCDLSLKLDQPTDTPATGNNTGNDAKDLEIALPATATFSCKPAAVTVVQADDMKQSLYGSVYKYTSPGLEIYFEPLLNRVMISYNSSASECTIASEQSSWVNLHGTAAIQKNAWALPVTVAAPASLGEAAGIGAIAMKTAPGLKGQWEGLNRGQISLKTAYVMTEPGRIAITAATAASGKARQQFELWNEGDDKTVRSTMDINYPKQFILLYNSISSGSETLAMIGVGMNAALDRPLSANKQRLWIHALRSDLVLFEMNDKRYVHLFAKDMLQQLIHANQLGQTQAISFALRNALIKTTPVDDVYILGTWHDKKDIRQGAILLNCPVYFLLPSLPDPYVSTFNPLNFARRYELTQQSTANRGMGLSLLSVIYWTEPKSPKLSLLFIPDSTSPVVFTLLEQNKPLALKKGLDAGPSIAAYVEPQASEPVYLFHYKQLNQVAEVRKEDEENSAALRDLFDAALRVSQEHIYLLDVSTNADLFGVGLSIAQPRTRKSGLNTSPFPLAVDKMDLVTYANNTRIYTLPQIQWEPVRTIQNPDVSPHPFPSPATSEDTGDPTIVGSESYELVPIAPIPVIDKFIEEYNDAGQPKKMAALFSLPFGMKAVAYLDNAHDTTQPGAQVSYNDPVFDRMQAKGGLQISVMATAVDSGPTVESPHFKGATIQTRNLIDLLTGIIPLDDEGKPLSVLGPVVDTIFNGEFKAAGANPRVPLERMDISGYGATIFSNWLNPQARIAATSQAKFDVIIGRTAHEIIQVKSILYPWGVAVVRTITIQRTPGGGVTRYDTGWKAQGPGLYDFSYTDKNGVFHANPYEFHPGVVKGIYNVTEIRDTGRIYRANAPDPLDNVIMQEVFFNADVFIEDVSAGAFNGFVPSKKQRGFVQLAPYEKVLTKEQLYALLTTEGNLGGPVDCTVDVGRSGQPMRVVKVDVSGVVHAGSEVFVTSARGSLHLPKEGSWSMVKRYVTSPDIVTLDGGDSLPLVREGRVNMTTTRPYRFADAADIKNTTSPLSDYGILHSMGSQKVLFLRPFIEEGNGNIKSSMSPFFADSYAILGSSGIFPALQTTFELGSGGTNLEIKGDGKLKLTSGGNFTAPSGYTRDLLNAGGSRIYVDYRDVADGTGPAQVSYSFDSTAPVPWQASVRKHSIVTDLDPFTGVMSVTSDIESDATKSPGMSAPKMKFGSVLQPVIDLLSFLGGFDMASAFEMNMGNATTNSWQPKWKASLKGLQIKYAAPSRLEIKVFGKRIREVGVAGTPLPPFKLGFGIEIEGYYNMLPFSFTSDSPATDIARARHEMLAVGAALKLEGEAKILIPSTILYFVGILELEFGVDSKKGKLFGLKLAVGLEVGAHIPVIGEVAVMLAIGLEVELNDHGSAVLAILILRGEAEILGGLIAIGIGIEAKGGQERETEAGVTSVYTVYEVEFSFEMTLAFVIHFEFDVAWQEKRQLT